MLVFVVTVLSIPKNETTSVNTVGSVNEFRFVLETPRRAFDGGGGAAVRSGLGDGVAPQSQVAVHPGGSHRDLPESPLNRRLSLPEPTQAYARTSAKPQSQPTCHT